MGSTEPEVDVFPRQMTSKGNEFARMVIPGVPPKSIPQVLGRAKVHEPLTQRAQNSSSSSIESRQVTVTHLPERNRREKVFPGNTAGRDMELETGFETSGPGRHGRPLFEFRVF